MAYCRKCGKEIDDEAVICPHCGVQQYTKAVSDDDGSAVWAVIGFLIPIVGILLWALWRSEKPKSARMAGLGALASFIVAAVIIVVYIVIIGFLIASTNMIPAIV